VCPATVSVFEIPNGAYTCLTLSLFMSYLAHMINQKNIKPLENEANSQNPNGMYFIIITFFSFVELQNSRYRPGKSYSNREF